MADYYTYKDKVLLLPGQTLGFTPGKGYYAKGSPTPAPAPTPAPTPAPVQPAAVQPTPSTASGGGDGTTYFTYKADVPLQSGQTLGFTSGRGYYAAGTPTPAPAPTPAQPVAVQPVSAATGSAAGTPTPTAPPAQQAAVQPVASAASSGGGTTYYTYKADVPLKAGQTLGFTTGKGYYAAGTPTSAPARPADIQPVAVQPVISAAPGGDSGTTYYTFKEDVPLQPGQTIGFTPGRGYYGIGPGSRLPPGVELNPTQPTQAHPTPPQPATRGLVVQPTAAGTPIPHASEMENITPSRQLLAAQPSAAGTPTPSSRQEQTDSSVPAVTPLDSRRPLSDAPSTNPNDWSFRTKQVYVFQYLKYWAKLAPEAAAGVLGNLMWESNLDQSHKFPFGIVQWLGPRITNLETYASTHPGDASDFLTQVAFMVYELKKSYPTVLYDLQHTHSADVAAKIVFDRYEIAQDDTLGHRQRNARIVMGLHHRGLL